MEDSKIIDLYWERSESAIKETQLKYGKLCNHIAMNVLHNIENVEECVNDTYLGAWNAMPSQRPNILSAFLCRITRNIALKKYEYNHAQKRNPEIEASFTELDDCITSSENVEEQYEAIYIAKLVSQFLRTLSYENRNIFLRRYWYFDSISEIANCFQYSESKVKSMLFRIRMKLKEQLEKEGVTL